MFVRTFRRNTELLINIIFNERRKIGEKHRDIKFLKNRDGGSTIEIFNGESAFQFLIFRFHRPAVKVEFTEHIGSKRRVEKIGGKVFFGTIVKDNFDNPNSNTRDYGEGVAGTVFRDLEVVFQAHKTEMPLRSRVAEEILRIIAPVKNNDTVMEDPEIFKDFEMFDSGRTFGSKIMM